MTALEDLMPERDMKLRNIIAVVIQHSDNDRIPTNYSNVGGWSDEASDWSAYLTDAVVSAVENAGWDGPLPHTLPGSAVFSPPRPTD